MMCHLVMPLLVLLAAPAGLVQARPAAAPAPAPTPGSAAPAPAGAPLPSPPAAGGWSPWLGRPAAQAAVGICPCGSFLSEWNLWYEQGVQAGPDDSGPISGLDALCGGAADDGSTPSMLDLTGQGPPDFNETFSDGLGEVDGQHGTFLDNLLGVGGTGPSLVSWSCEPGQVITGVEVASEAFEASPTGSLLTGLPPPESPPPLPPPAANWSAWLGPRDGPPDYPIANCPCGYVSRWRLWSDAALVEGSESGALYGLAIRCAGADGASLEPLEVLPGGEGTPTAVVSSQQGFSGIKGLAGGLIDSLYGEGGRGARSFAHACAPPAVVVGVEVAVEPRGDRQYLAGLRMNCGVPTVASCAAPPPPVLPSPSLSPVVLPPVPVVVPTPLPVLPGAPAGAPEPTPLPALPGAPAVAPGDPLLAGVSPWLGPKAGPGSYSGICPCGSFVTSWSIWADSGFSQDSKSGALSGLAAGCGGAATSQLDVIPDAGDPSGSTNSGAGYTSIGGLGGTLVNSLLGMGGTGPTPFSHVCPAGQLIQGVQVATNKVGTTEYIAGLSVLCGDPASPTCINGLPGAFPANVYAELRRTCQVQKAKLFDGSDMWLITKHTDLKQVLVDNRLSKVRTHPGFPELVPGAKAAVEGREPTFVDMDPPQHTKFRGIFEPWFTKEYCEGLHPSIRANVDEEADQHCQGLRPSF
ncbi:cytochrome P450 [Micractinium conductrix]|uniref:Cytochrome P450 n=1 Tax=Micractinium conductrix TaxID=554055 RepID=A0A2P6VSC8_9CHLO|nr:cytochrome P450 [Micractinium conductrix]|eukprot:PSC76994.1 cytochrome P450 [Micractinium conductrix]